MAATLTPGTRLGTYEIVSSMGAGGMGEVYRAPDGQGFVTIEVDAVANSLKIVVGWLGELESATKPK